MSKQSLAQVTRRGFVSTAAALAAGAAAAATVGSNADRALANESVADVAWDEEFDAIVVGAGLAGASTAATIAVEGGDALKVLLIEKGDDPLGGGNSHYSGGSVIMTDNEHKAGALNYWKELRGACTSTPDDVLENFVEHMATTEDFLAELGCDPADYTLFAPGQAHFLTEGDGGAEYSSGSIISCWPEYPEFEDSVSVGRLIFSGKEMTTWSVFMEHVVEEHADSITFKTNAALTGLVQDPENKGVVGIVYDDNGTVKHAKARRGVVMTLGGFEHNADMLENYLSITHAYHIAGTCNTGDGYRLCDDLGAAFWHMNSMAGTWNGATKLDGSLHAMWFTTGRQYGITVGVNGRRYYMDVDYVVSQNWYGYQQGEARLDTTTSCRHGHYNFGGEWPHMILPAKSWFVFDSDNLENAVRGGVMKLTDGDPVEEGWAVKADTIEELAGLMDVPANELVTTVDTWNESCEKGVDVQFYRAPDWQTPIRTAPFYAIPMEPEFINTDGGPVRDAQAHIIDRDGNPIPGLYSAGEFGSVWCNMYQGGGNLSECVQFGRIAAENIIKGEYTIA